MLDLSASSLQLPCMVLSEQQSHFHQSTPPKTYTNCHQNSSLNNQRQCHCYHLTLSTLFDASVHPHSTTDPYFLTKDRKNIQTMTEWHASHHSNLVQTFRIPNINKYPVCYQTKSAHWLYLFCIQALLWCPNNAGKCIRKTTMFVGKSTGN